MKQLTGGDSNAPGDAGRLLGVRTDLEDLAIHEPPPGDSRDRIMPSGGASADPFNTTFHDPGKGDPVKDPRMEEKFTAELPGILAWPSRAASVATRRIDATSSRP